MRSKDFECRTGGATKHMDLPATSRATRDFAGRVDCCRRASWLVARLPTDRPPWRGNRGAASAPLTPQSVGVGNENAGPKFGTALKRPIG